MAQRISGEHRSVDVEGVGLLEIDRTVYNWFNYKHPTQINARKVPVVFGSWERWAQMQGNKEDENLNNQRDHKGMIKLPIISISRGDVSFDNERFVRKTENNDPAVTIIKRIAAAQFDPDQRIDFQSKHAIASGDGPRYSANAPVYEVQSVPYPDFVNITYTISFWSSYVSHVNKFHEMVWQEAYPTDFEYNGHRFFASIQTQSDDGNVENFSDEERIIRHTFNMEVSAYLLDINPKIKIDRTVTKIAIQELVIDTDEIKTTRDGHDLTLPDIVETGERIDFYNRGIRTDVDDTIYAITTEDGEILITESELAIAGDLALTNPSYIGPNDSNNQYG
jgi:hypothetical protein|tara:strand:- start:638 stop:1645 length:1008 start_codon:yes stop_codon:yes gene_type:complete